MHDTLQRLRKTKFALLGTVLTSTGLLFLIATTWAEARGWSAFADSLVVNLGGGLFTTGLVVVAVQYIDQRDAEEQRSQQLRRLLREEAPAIRDSVIDGFAFAPDSLTSVASPQTLDRIVENCLAIQLGNKELASDVYRDLRSQVLNARELRHDVRISVSLAPWDEGPRAGSGSMFVATVRWDYAVHLDAPFLRFSCVSDISEFRALRRDPTSTDAWYFEPVGELDAGSPEAFELVQIAIDGRSLPLHRSPRSGSQSFAVKVPDDIVISNRAAQVSFTYRLLVQKNSHSLHLDFDKPCKDVEVELRYDNADIRHVNVLDYIAGAEEPFVQRSPQSVPSPGVTVRYEGWALPGSGVAFVWVLKEELPIRQIVA